MCQLKKNSRGIAIEKFGSVPIAPATIVDGSIMNSTSVVSALRGLIKTHNLRRKQVALSISGHSVIIKKIPLPPMTRAELDASIQWEAEQFIPFDMKDVYLDVQILGPTPGVQNQMDVLLVAAKKDFVNEYTAVLVESGLEPVVCDVDAFAIENAVLQNYEVPQDQCVAIVNVGCNKTNINILAGKVSAFTRDLGIGGIHFTEAIQKQRSLTYEEAENLKLSGKFDSQTQNTVQNSIDTLTREIQRSIDFYTTTSSDSNPSFIYLCGGSARLPMLAKSIASHLELKVEVVDPFRRLVPASMDVGLLQTAAPSATVAVGLALRFPGDS